MNAGVCLVGQKSCKRRDFRCFYEATDSLSLPSQMLLVSIWHAHCNQHESLKIRPQHAPKAEVIGGGNKCY